MIRRVPDILLVICPPWGVDTPPLGLASLATHLRNHGFLAEILDFNINLFNKMRHKHGHLWEMGSALYWRNEDVFLELRETFQEEIAACVEAIISKNIPIVGFSVLSNSQDRVTIEVIKLVKQRLPGIKIILGGTSVSVPEQRSLFSQEIPDLIEAFVVGEGEETIVEIIKKHRSGERWDNVSGVLIPGKNGSEFSPRIIRGDLDAFPYPTFEEFDFGLYKNKTHGLIADWSRGCVGSCLFCAFKTVSGRFRHRSPEQIVAAVAFYVKKYDVEHISLVDSAINGDLELLEETCDLLIEARSKVKISGLAIPNRGMTLDLLTKMKRAGFVRVEYGIESGSDMMLKQMGKLYGAIEAEEVLKFSREAGMFTVIYLIVGFPGEGEEEFQETLDFLKRNARYIDLVKSANPLFLMAGSVLRQHYQDYGISLPEMHNDMKWFIGKDNTYQIRLNRVERIRSLLSELNIACFKEDNMFERKIDLKRLNVDCPAKEKNDDFGKVNEGQDALPLKGRGVPADIALVMVPPWQTKMPPLGLAYLSSYLRAYSVQTRVIDLNVSLFNEADEGKRYLWDIAAINDLLPVPLGQRFCCEFSTEIEKFIEDMVCSEESIIGFSTTIASVNIAIHMAREIKRRNPSKVMILGGAGVFWETQNLDPERTVDILVVGEGEQPLLEIVRRFQKTRKLSDLAGIPGIIVRLGEKDFSFPKPDPVKNLDDIPRVDFSGFDLKAYSPDRICRSLPVLISRGCINHCSFCVDHKMNFPFRARSPEKILEELKYYIREVGVNDFEFNDLLCNGNLRQLEEFCDMILKENLKIRWHSYAAIRSGMTAELLKKMKASGCHRLCYGMESASDVVLKKMGKPYNSQMAEQVVRDTHNAGISTAINIIIGHPGESAEEFKRTYDFVKKNKDFIDEITNVSTCFLMLETDLVKDSEKYGIYFKKTFRERWAIFWKKQPYRCNLRQFYAHPGNSPRARAARLRTLMLLINKLKIPQVIINRATEDDSKFDEVFLQQKQKSWFVPRAHSLKVVLDGKARAGHIYFKNQKLTRNVGLNTSFKVGDVWVDASKGEWEVKDRGQRLFLKVMFKDIPVVQDWFIHLRRKSFSWEVATFFLDEVGLTQRKVGIVFSDRYHLYCAQRAILEFPHTRESWTEVGLLRSDQVELISTLGLPKICCRSENSSRKGALFELQNLPRKFSARMINFCFSDANDLRDDGQDMRFFKKGDMIKNGFTLTLEEK